MPLPSMEAEEAKEVDMDVEEDMDGVLEVEMKNNDANAFFSTAPILETTI